MALKATKAFSSTVFGNVSQDESLPEISKELAEHLIENGLVYETKVIETKPEPAKRKRKVKDDD